MLPDKHYHVGNIIAAAHLSMGHTPQAIKQAARRKQKAFEAFSAEYEYYQGIIDRANAEANKKPNGAYRES